MNWFWRLVFWWKRRTGWIDLCEVVTATGVVVGIDAPGADGDGSFDITVDDDQRRLITGFGGRITTADPALYPSLHCEVEPWASDALRAAFTTLEVGDRVRVTGRWGFDGVHTGQSLWLEVLLALVRHAPNVRDGWFEIHPVESIEHVS